MKDSMLFLCICLGAVLSGKAQLFLRKADIEKPLSVTSNVAKPVDLW